MNGSQACFAILLLLLNWTGAAQAPKPPAVVAQTDQARKPKEFWRKMLRISGVAYSPSTLKGPGDEVVTGEIWIADVTSGRTRKLTAEAGFRSPVFTPGNNEILALKAPHVVRLPVTGGEPQRVCDVAGAYKLIGFSMDDRDKVLVVTEDEAGRSEIELLSIAGGKSFALQYDSASVEDRRMVEHLRGWDRVYGDTGVYVKRQSKATLGGTVEWLDVFFKAGTAEAVNASRCDGVNCGQPSLSNDGKKIVFVKSQ